MICYVDSSIVLRKLLRQSEQLSEWSAVTKAVSSRLLRLECLRTLDRYRIMGLTSEEVSEARHRLFSTLNDIGMLPLADHVLRTAEQSLTVPLGSLDSIHLASALLWRETRGDDLVFATHDTQLALAAKAHGFKVIGV